MTEAANQKEVSLREALHMEIIINQGLIELLVSKGVITHAELMDKIKEVKKRMDSEAPEKPDQVCWVRMRENIFLSEEGLGREQI